LVGWEALVESEGRKNAAALVEKYIQRQLRYRAKMIARTETKNAAAAGSQLLWEQAQAEGVLSLQARKYWLLSPGACPKCEQTAAMNPDGVLIGQSFQTPIGPRVHPTLHPQCSCGLSVRVPK